MRKFLMVFALLTLNAAIAFGQSRTVSGSVKDDTGSAVPFATISETGTRRATTADANGNFEIKITPNASLIVTATGFTALTVTPEGSSVSVLLKRNPAELTAVVVTTALGLRSNRDNLTVAQSSVKGAELTKSGETSVLNALSSKASGVQVVSSGSDPGESAYIQIRGQSTITGNLQPLFVIDGIPVSNSSLGNTVGTGTSQQSRISDINPEDIASVDILKGASAGVLYGSRAANGVVLITTKKGKASAGKINISLNSTYSTDVLNKSVPLQTTFGQGFNGRYAFGSRYAWGDKISDRTGGSDTYLTSGAYALLADGTKRYKIANGTVANIHGGKNSTEIYDHAKELFHNGNYFNNTLALSGGDEKSQYYVSLANDDQQGILKERSNYHRRSFNFNAQRRFSDIVNMSTNFEYSNVKSNRVQQGSNTSGIFLGGLRTPGDFNNQPYTATYVDASGALYPNRELAYRNPIGASTSSIYDNPFWVLHNITSTTAVNRLLGSYEINVNATPWLNFLSRTGVDYYSDDRTDNFPVISATFPGGNLTVQELSEMSFNTDLLARVKSKLSSVVDFNGFVGLNYNNRLYENIGATVSNFILPDAPFNLQNSAGASRTPFNSNSVVRTTAGYVQLGFTAFDALILNLTGRAEHPSTVSKTFYFPSASLAWQFSKLKSLSESHTLSFGKIRGSYGEVGVEPGPYLNQTYYGGASVSESYGPALDASSPVYGGGYLRSTTKGNPDLSPERKKEYEGGLDLRFFADRLSFSGTYYSNKTVGAILPVQVPATTGFEVENANAASIQNKGIETDLGITWLKRSAGKFSITTDIIWSQNKNKVLSLNGTKQIGLSGFTGVISSAVPGYGLGAFWGVGYDRDSKGSLVLDANGFPTVAPTESVLGDPNPDWTGAINTTVSYKGINFSFLFDHVQGGDVWNGTRAALTTIGTAAVTGTEVKAPTDLKAYNGSTIAAGTTFRGSIVDWGAGPVALTQPWYQDIGGGFGTATGPQFFEKGTRTRLREISLGYTLSGKNFSQKTKFQSIDFSFTGRNIILWANYQGIDPETNLAGPSNGRGIDYFNNPSSRSYLFSIKINY